MLDLFPCEIIEILLTFLRFVDKMKISTTGNSLLTRKMKSCHVSLRYKQKLPISAKTEYMLSFFKNIDSIWCAHMPFDCMRLLPPTLHHLEVFDLYYQVKDFIPVLPSNLVSLTLGETMDLDPTLAAMLPRSLRSFGLNISSDTSPTFVEFLKNLPELAVFKFRHGNSRCGFALGENEALALPKTITELKVTFHSIAKQEFFDNLPIGLTKLTTFTNETIDMTNIPKGVDDLFVSILHHGNSTWTPDLIPPQIKRLSIRLSYDFSSEEMDKLAKQLVYFNSSVTHVKMYEQAKKKIG